MYFSIQSCALRFSSRVRACGGGGARNTHEQQADSNARLFIYSVAAAAAAVHNTMPLKLGDVVKLFYKNIHVSARSKHFKELKEGDHVLVKVKAIDVRGEGRQMKGYATVVYPHDLAEGANSVWEGITLAKNLVLHQVAPVAEADHVASEAPVALADDPDHPVSDGSSISDEDDAEEAPDPDDLRGGWSWRPCTIDMRSMEGSYQDEPKLINVGDIFDTNSPYHYWNHFLPALFIRDSLIPLINTAFDEEVHVTLHEFHAWLAVLIAKSLWGVPDEVFWSLPIGTRLSAIMDPKRFVAIWKAMDPMRATWGDPADPHRHVTPIIEAFNAHMLECFKAGSDLCLDESMLLWLGKVYLMDGWVVHERKPDPKGYEMKAVCDVSTNILLRLELCGSEKNKYIERKKFFSEVGSRKIAQIMRLLEPWFGSGRSVTADSGFGSPMAVAILRENGLFSNMMIKKARYWPQYVPNDIIDKLPKEFDSVVSCSKCIETHTKSSIKVVLTAHRDMHPRLYCHTLSVSTRAQLPFLMYKRIGNAGRTVLQLLEVQPPQVGQHYSRTRNAVDLHNGHRKRPKTELVETQYCTHPAQKMLLFFLASVEANAKIAYSLYSSGRSDDWWTFRSLLVESLIHIGSSDIEKHRKRPRSPAAVARHYLVFVSDMSDADKAIIWPQGRPTHERGRCTGCKKICHSVCNCCRTKWICKRDCFAKHVAEVMIIE